MASTWPVCEAEPKFAVFRTRLACAGDEAMALGPRVFRLEVACFPTVRMLNWAAGARVSKVDLTAEYGCEVRFLNETNDHVCDTST
jgi:hypothetical protein